MNSTAVLMAKSVSHRYTNEQGEVIALRDVSLRVAKGEFVALVGPSGGGKSTLLRMFAGLVRPTQGQVLYRGVPLTAPPADAGVVFQKPSLLPWQSVWENIALPLTLRGADDSAAVTALVAAVGLEGFEQALPATLSGGMQQRVALARALITRPGLLLMDEPFAALDMMLRHEMNSLLLTLWQANHPTVLFVTHDLHEAVYLADRVILLSARPGHILGDLPIILPRPRAEVSRYGSEIQSYVERIWRSL